MAKDMFSRIKEAERRSGSGAYDPRATKMWNEKEPAPSEEADRKNLKPLPRGEKSR